MQSQAGKLGGCRARWSALPWPAIWMTLLFACVWGPALWFYLTDYGYV